MHHNSPNIFPPWIFKETLNFNFKEFWTSLYIIFPNPYQQTTAGQHTNHPKRQTRINHNFYPTAHPCKVRHIKRKIPGIIKIPLSSSSQRYNDSFFNSTKIKYQTYHLHEHYHYIWPYYGCCLWHDTWTWTNWTHIIILYGLISPWIRRITPKILP